MGCSNKKMPAAPVGAGGRHAAVGGGPGIATSDAFTGPGDRIKTGARDAPHLARLLRLDEVVSVRVPTQAEESARDLVRAREAARQDLMRSRHRVSKLLLRNGISGAAGTRPRPRHELAGTPEISACTPAGST